MFYELTFLNAQNGHEIIKLIKKYYFLNYNKQTCIENEERIIIYLNNQNCK